MNQKQPRRAARTLGSLLAAAAIATGAAAQASPQVNSAEELFGWAEGNYSDLFPQPPERGTFANYTYRFYPGSGWAIAVQQGQVYGFHDLHTQRQMLHLTGAVCELAPGLCLGSTPRPPEPNCGRFVEGPEFALNMNTWVTGGHASTTAQAKLFDPVEMGASADARACQALCNGDSACTAWVFEAIGSNFRTLPVCFRFDGRAALFPPSEGHPGNAVGVKPGVRQIVDEAGTPCD